MGELDECRFSCIDDFSIDGETLAVAEGWEDIVEVSSERCFARGTDHPLCVAVEEGESEVRDFAIGRTYTVIHQNSVGAGLGGCDEAKLTLLCTCCIFR